MGQFPSASGSGVSRQRYSNIPLNKCNPNTAQRVTMKRRNAATFAIYGKDLSKELTRILKPSTLLILLNGLNSLIVLKAPCFQVRLNIDKKPVTTTIKSSLFQPSFMQVPRPNMNPIAITFAAHSKINKTVITVSIQLFTTKNGPLFSTSVKLTEQSLLAMLIALIRMHMVRQRSNQIHSTNHTQ